MKMYTSYRRKALNPATITACRECLQEIGDGVGGHRLGPGQGFRAKWRLNVRNGTMPSDPKDRQLRGVPLVDPSNGLFSVFSINRAMGVASSLRIVTVILAPNLLPHLTTTELSHRHF